MKPSKPSLKVSPEQKFTHFSKLPVEIRLMIWTYCANIPRNLDIWAVPIGDPMLAFDSHGASQKRFRKLATTQLAPGILSANQESRAIALDFYQLGFSVDFILDRDNELRYTTPARIRINYQVDCVCPMGSFEADQGDRSCHKFAFNSSTINFSNLRSVRNGSLPLAEIFAIMIKAHDKSEKQSELLLYHCTNFPVQPGFFDFVDVTEETAINGEWEELLQARERLWEAIVKVNIEGRVEAEKESTEHFMAIKFVGLVSHGVRLF